MSELPKAFYLTTPIFYLNAELHLGHAYTLVVADVISRYKKSQGYTVYWQTGSDDYGGKIEKKAQTLNLTPQTLVDQNFKLFQKLIQELKVEPDFFYRTSSPQHQTKVQKIFGQLLKQGNIYWGTYQGSYCLNCEDYSKEKICPYCQSTTQTLQEKAYFFSLAPYRQQLLKYYQKNPNFLSPISAKKELFTNFLRATKIPDWCVTRSQVSWGIPVPQNNKLVVYVWLEALTNYLNSTKGESFFANLNSEIVHLIGKEIVRFHAFYWPIILLALGQRLPNQVIAHGWLLFEGGKMSKSQGNIINPRQILKQYPADLLRVYFLAKINFGQDGKFQEDSLREFYQAFFLHNLGNLSQRIGKMIEIYHQSIIPDFTLSSHLQLENYQRTCLDTLENYQTKMNNYQLTEAFEEIELLLKASNQLIEQIKPWNLFKETGDFSKKKLLSQTLNYLANGIRIIVSLLSPFAPESSQIIFDYLNLPRLDQWVNLSDFHLVSKRQINSRLKPLFSPLIAN